MPMLFVNSLMGAPTPTPYNVYNPLVWRKWLLLLRCMLCLLMHTHLPLRSLIWPEPKSALSWFRVVAVQHDSHLQWQEASRMTNGSLSGLQMYVQLEFVLQTFWKIYLRLANCLMSYFGAIFCLSFFLSCFFLARLCHWWHSQSLHLNRAWLKWSQFQPMQYLNKLSPLLFFSFPTSPPFLLIYSNFFSTQKHLLTCTHAVSAIRTSDSDLGTPFHTARPLIEMTLSCHAEELLLH